MSKNRDTEPALDYFELRRRHEEYKNSLRQAKAKAEAGEADAADAVKSAEDQAEAAVEAAVDEAASTVGQAAESIADEAADAATEVLSADEVDGEPAGLEDALSDDAAFEDESLSLIHI